MSITNRTLLKRDDSIPANPAVRLDDASDRVAVLAGRVINQFEDGRDVDQDDVDDLRAALEDTSTALGQLEDEV